MFKKVFLLLTLTFAVLGSSTQCFCEEIDQEEDYLEKVYVQPEQIHITREGIFYLNKVGCLAPACGVFCDRSGIYVMAKHFQCPSCGRWNADNVCKNKWCPLYNW